MPFQNDGSGILDINIIQPHEGLFRRLLRFKALSGDHCQRTFRGTKNALYTSHRIQNEIIQSIGQEILDIIIRRIKKARFYIIMADETTDISSTEQISLCLRYIDQESQELKEDFIGFLDKWKHVPVSDSSYYPKTLLDAIKECDKDVYLSVNALLEIGCILPVSTSTVERSFSKLKLLKTYLRSSTSED